MAVESVRMDGDGGGGGDVCDLGEVMSVGAGSVEGEAGDLHADVLNPGQPFESPFRSGEPRHAQSSALSINKIQVPLL